MLNMYCLLGLQIRIATILKENAKFNDKFYLGTTRLLLQNPKRYLSYFTREVSASRPPHVASSDTVRSYGELAIRRQDGD